MESDTATILRNATGRRLFQLVLQVATRRLYVSSNRSNGCSKNKRPITQLPLAIVGALVNDITCNAANGPSNNGSG
jgi:hypothetical protein